MSMVNGNFSIKCNKCGTQHDFPANEAEFEFDGGEERQMGAENSYSWNSSFNCDCGNEIEFEYGIWEYPVGAYNNDNVDITNGTEVERYSYDFSEEPEPEDL